MMSRDRSVGESFGSRRLRRVGVVVCLMSGLVMYSCSRQQEQARTELNYPAPRYPRYLVEPNMNELLRAARIAVRQPAGRCPLGRVEPGQSVHVLIQWGQDTRVWEAIQQAWAEKGVEAHAIGYWEIMGITKKEYDSQMAPAIVHGDEAWKELGNFRTEYRPFFPEEVQKQFGEPITDVYLRTTFLSDYLDKHPEVKNIYAGTGNAGAWRSGIGPKHGDKMIGNWVYIRPIDLLSKAADFPADVWTLVEEKILRPRPFVSEVTFQDPEGTNLHWSMTREQAQRWGSGGGGGFAGGGGGGMGGGGGFPGGDEASNHISIYPNPLRSTLHEGGVIVSHGNHTGIFPTMIAYLDKHGLVTRIEGGGKTGELFQMLLDHPTLKNAKFPNAPGPGYWFFRTDGFATNPKFVRSMPALIEGEAWLPNASERNRAGVQHLAFSYSADGPEDVAYAREKGIPLEHTAHMHVYFPTVKWKLRDTGEWITIADKGYVVAYDDPEVRALASRYGDPDMIFRYEWIPSIPGVNVQGDYKKDFEPDPWGWLMREWKSIQDGSYQYFVDDYKTETR